MEIIKKSFTGKLWYLMCISAVVCIGLPWLAHLLRLLADKLN